MGFAFNVKDKYVLFSNDAVKDLPLFKLEFITDAPKLCRLLRKEAKNTHDPQRLIHIAKKEEIKASFNQLEEPAHFWIRFDNPYNRTQDLTVHVTIHEW